jgi:hypothetical protein
MKYHRNTDAINKRCEILMEHGFDINHQDSNVSLGELTFDFSAIELTTINIMNIVAKKAYQAGITKGQNDLKNEFKRLLTTDDTSDK